MDANWTVEAVATCPLTQPPVLTLCDLQAPTSFALRDPTEDHPIGPSLLFAQGNLPVYLVLAPDGHTLVTWQYQDVALGVWDLNPDDWAQRGCVIAGRNFTTDEWNRYLTPQEPYRAICSHMPLPPPGS